VETEGSKSCLISVNKVASEGIWLKESMIELGYECLHSAFTLERDPCISTGGSLVRQGSKFERKLDALSSVVVNHRE